MTFGVEHGGGMGGVDDEDRDLRRLKNTVAHAAEQ